MEIHPLAAELNKQIKDSSPNTFACLSDIGKQIFYPTGILSQAAEAKNKTTRFNATIGVAMENREPMFLEATRSYFNHLKPSEIFTYAPPDGLPQLREAWKEKIVRNNPTLSEKKISLPVVTSALTHGLNSAAEMLVGPDDVVIIPDKFWGNYRLIFSIRRGARLSHFPMFDSENGFNVAAMADLMKKEAKSNGKLVIVLNTPNNPTGYTPTVAESEAILSAIREQANQGTRIVTLTDDAYFGLFYEDSVKESLFTGLCDLHENVLAVKLDAATKENFAWGFRTGFMTFGTVTNAPDKLYPALETKVKGLLRSSISSSNHPSQHIIARLLKDPDYQKGIDQKFEILKSRALTLKKVLSDERYREEWTFYPFNSGYFMCLKLHRVNAEQLRIYLLEQYQVGTISINDTDLRIAFSSVEEEDIEEMILLIHQAVKELS